MKRTEKWALSEKEKAKFIANLTAEIPALRAKLGISQGDLARLIGISRQTLSAIERDERDMSWDTYLSMLFFFDYNKLTHQTIRDIDIFPESMLKRFNDGDKEVKGGVDTIADDDIVAVFDKLDDKAMNTLKTTLLVEYARCSEMSIDEVIKLFADLKLEKPKKAELPARRGRKRKNLE